MKDRGYLPINLFYDDGLKKTAADQLILSRGKLIVLL